MIRFENSKGFIRFDSKAHTRNIAGLLLFAGLIFLNGCNQPEVGSGWRTTQPQTASLIESEESVLTIGDIDADTPVHRMNQIRPLANYLAHGLGWENTNRVRIRIARSVAEMALMIQEGKVDIFMDSTYPTLAVRRQTGTRIIAESIINGKRSYHTLLIAGRDTGRENLSDLVGHTIALQDRNSTSGYMLPAGVLLKRGFSITQTTGPKHLPPPEHIGYFFSGDEENTLSMIRNGIVDAGAISVLDYESLPSEIREELIILASSPEVPRKLTSVAASMSEELALKITDILLSISESDLKQMTEEQSQYSTPWKWHFQASNHDSEAEIASFESLMNLVEAVGTE